MIIAEKFRALERTTDVNEAVKAAGKRDTVHLNTYFLLLF